MVKGERQRQMARQKNRRESDNTRNWEKQTSVRYRKKKAVGPGALAMACSCVVIHLKFFFHFATLQSVSDAQESGALDLPSNKTWNRLGD